MEENAIFFWWLEYTLWVIWMLLFCIFIWYSDCYHTREAITNKAYKKWKKHKQLRTELLGGVAAGFGLAFCIYCVGRGIASAEIVSMRSLLVAIVLCAHVWHSPWIRKRLWILQGRLERCSSVHLRDEHDGYHQHGSDVTLVPINEHLPVEVMPILHDPRAASSVNNVPDPAEVWTQALLFRFEQLAKNIFRDALDGSNHVCTRVVYMYDSPGWEVDLNQPLSPPELQLLREALKTHCRLSAAPITLPDGHGVITDLRLVPVKEGNGPS